MQAARADIETVQRGALQKDVARPAWDRRLQPWRAASGLVALLQLPLMVVAFILVARSESRLLLVMTPAFASLEALKWAIDTAAIRRHPEADFAASYRRAPLTPNQRRFLTWMLALLPLEAVTLGYAIHSSFELSVALTALVVAVFGCSWVLPLERVRRRNSWLAMSRLPGYPRRQLEPEAPVPRVPRSRWRSALRWLAIVLLPIFITAIAFVLVALATR